MIKNIDYIANIYITHKSFNFVNLSFQEFLNILSNLKTKFYFSQCALSLYYYVENYVQR